MPTFIRYLTAACPKTQHNVHFRQLHTHTSTYTANHYQLLKHTLKTTQQKPWPTEHSPRTATTTTRVSLWTWAQPARMNTMLLVRTRAWIPCLSKHKCVCSSCTWICFYFVWFVLCFSLWLNTESPSSFWHPYLALLTIENRLAWRTAQTVTDAVAARMCKKLLCFFGSLGSSWYPFWQL